MKPTYKQVTKTRYIEQISQLAEEIFVQHYTKLTPKVARALAEKYQSDILTDDEIHSGTVNYFMIYLGSDPVGYFALDLTPTGGHVPVPPVPFGKSPRPGHRPQHCGLCPKTGRRRWPQPPISAGMGQGPES